MVLGIQAAQLASQRHPGDMIELNEPSDRGSVRSPTERRSHIVASTAILDRYLEYSILSAFSRFLELVDSNRKTWILRAGASDA